MKYYSKKFQRYLRSDHVQKLVYTHETRLIHGAPCWGLIIRTEKDLEFYHPEDDKICNHRDPNFINKKRKIGNIPGSHIREFASTKEWKTLYKKTLEKANYSCQNCFKKKEEVRLEIDHIVPIYKGGPEMNEKNLQVLCVNCHKQKTKTEWERN